jgi:5'-nucleotidase
MIVLLSNDDGIQSEGLTALETNLGHVGEIYTVAPERAQSSMSHALTLHRPLRVEELAPRRLAVDGTPVDCVKLSLTGLLPVRPPSDYLWNQQRTESGRRHHLFRHGFRRH